jgi:hypothetical protein
MTFSIASHEHPYDIHRPPSPKDNVVEFFITQLQVLKHIIQISITTVSQA